MPNLAVFDFDRTIVDDDSDATIIRSLEKKVTPPVWDSASNDWTTYMGTVFEYAYSAGLSEREILAAVGSMRPAAGGPALLEALAEAGWSVVLVTDANSVFVGHWLATHGLDHTVTHVLTNRAFFSDGRLHIEPHMSQSECARCPRHLCKWRALQRWRGDAQFERMVYVGDGTNDLCPALSMPTDSTVYPRRGYSLEESLRRAAAEGRPLPRVVPWDDARTIIEDLFPGRSMTNGS